MLNELKKLINFARVAAIIASLGFGFQTTLATQQDRLLPTTEEEKLEVDGKQDGRSVIISITNNSSLTVTSVKVKCIAMNELALRAHKMDCPLELPTLLYGGMPAKMDDAQKARCRFYPDSETVAEKVYNSKIAPGKTVEIYTEIKSGMTNLHCSIDEVRGRKKSWFE